MTNLMKRAAEELHRKNKQLQNIRATHKDEEAEMIGDVAAVAAAAGGAFVDKKWGVDGKPAQLFDTIPTNAGVGLALAGLAIFGRKMVPESVRKPMGMAGIGLACAAAYRYGLDNFEVEAAK